MDRPQSPNNQLVVSDASSKNIENQAGPSHPEALEDAEEYGCKYCTKKFSNKQALGGHQNAHKAERALEKAARDQNGAANPGLYQRSHRYVDMTVFSNFPLNAQQHGVRIGYNAYAPAQTLPGFNNNNYPGWAAPAGSGAPQFPGQGGNGNAGSRTVYPDLSIFAAPRDGNRDGMNDQQDEDESGLDLSLKL